MALTPEQVRIVRSTVPVLQQHGNAITSCFYSHLLKDVPDLRNVFNLTSQANNHQATALANALFAYASHIDDLGALSPAVEKICQKHASLYIRPTQYKVVGDYLLQAMGEVLGSALTKESLDAWTVAYWQLANLMIQREADIYQETGSWTDWRDFRIADKVKESDEITSFYLKPTDGQPLPNFFPGQYISVMTHVSRLQCLQPRQYSLSDAPHPEYYRISVKKEPIPNSKGSDDSASITDPGIVSNIFHDERHVGDTIKVSHPSGEFFLHPEEAGISPVVLMSAGVGVTPMVSMLNSLTKGDPKQPISFIHGARSRSVRAFHSHVRDIADRNPKIRFSPFIKNSDPQQDIEGHDYKHTGRVDLTKLDAANDLFLDDNSTQYYVCGPDSFMKDINEKLTNMGVKSDKIKMEVFSTGLV